MPTRLSQRRVQILLQEIRARLPILRGGALPQRNGRGRIHSRLGPSLQEAIPAHAASRDDARVGGDSKNRLFHQQSRPTPSSNGPHKMEDLPIPDRGRVAWTKDFPFYFGLRRSEAAVNAQGFRPLGHDQWLVPQCGYWRGYPPVS